SPRRPLGLPGARCGSPCRAPRCTAPSPTSRRWSRPSRWRPRPTDAWPRAASTDGRLAAVEHESINVTSASDDFVEYATLASQTTYATPAIRVRQRVQRAHLNLGTAMRAPVEGCGLWALGSAINELAAQLQIDPIELRLANHAD